MTHRQLHHLLLLLLLIVSFGGGAVQTSKAMSSLKSALKRLKSDTDKLVDSKVLEAKQRAISAIDTVINGLSNRSGNVSVTPGSVKIETIEVNENGIKVETLTTRIGAGVGPVAENCSFPWLLTQRDMCLWSPALKGNWFDANDFCRLHGGTLASYRSRQEVRIIEMFHPIDALCPWVGLYRTAESVTSRFAWVSGNADRYRYWARDQPDGRDHIKRRFPGSSCAILCQHGMLDMPCKTYAAPFVCQKRLG